MEEAKQFVDFCLRNIERVDNSNKQELAKFIFNFHAYILSRADRTNPLYDISYNELINLIANY